MRNKRRRKRIENIVEHARALGVTRQHLSYVLHGHRQSPVLLRRYKKLIKEEGTL